MRLTSDRQRRQASGTHTAPGRWPGRLGVGRAGDDDPAPDVATPLDDPEGGRPSDRP